MKAYFARFAAIIGSVPPSWVPALWPWMAWKARTEQGTEAFILAGLLAQMPRRDRNLILSEIEAGKES